MIALACLHCGHTRPRCQAWLQRLQYRPLSLAIGERDEATGYEIFEAILKDYGRKPIYTDGQADFPTLFLPGGIAPMRKAVGIPTGIEGVNRILRPWVSYLVSRSLTYARNLAWLRRRRYLIHCRNLEILQRAQRGK